MPSKKKKYNARFPAGRIKKIMQSDEEIGKVAQAVPVIISRTLELFVESLLTKTLRITNSRNAKTLSPSHMKQCIMSEQRFDFLKELVRNIPDISVAEEAAFNYNEDDIPSSEEPYPDSDTPYDLSLPSTSLKALPNGNNAYVRSISLNGSGIKRNHNQLTHPIKIQTAPGTSQVHQLADHLPTKLSRSESTPTYSPRDRSLHTTLHYNTGQMDSTMPESICNFELLNKPVVKIDYSNVKLTSANLCSTNINSASSANTEHNFNISPPVINIDLTNMVSSGTVPTKTNYELSNNLSVGGNTNLISNFGSSLKYIGENSKTLNIPKTPLTSAPIAESHFELDEDYDNI